LFICDVNRYGLTTLSVIDCQNNNSEGNCGYIQHNCWSEKLSAACARRETIQQVLSINRTHTNIVLRCTVTVNAWR